MSFVFRYLGRTVISTLWQNQKGRGLWQGGVLEGLGT